MKTKEKQPIKLHFPFDLYFQQLFARDTYVKFINPFSFWRRYRINHLETCWEIKTFQRLASFHQIALPPDCSPPNDRPIQNSTQAGIYRGVPWQKTPQQKILVAQPGIKLTYRGITYSKSRIVAINANQVEVKSNL